MCYNGGAYVTLNERFTAKPVHNSSISLLENSPLVSECSVMGLVFVGGTQALFTIEVVFMPDDLA